MSKSDAWKADAIRLKQSGVAWGNLPAAIEAIHPGVALTVEQIRSALRYDHEYRAIEKPTDKFTRKSTEAPPANAATAEPRLPASDDILADGSHRSVKILELMLGKKYSPDEMLVLHGFDPPDAWELVSCKSNAWHGMTGKQRDNELVELRQSTAIARPRKNELTLDDVKQVFRELATEYKRPILKYKPASGDMLAEVNIADLHLGKLCWRGDTACDYDHKIARQIWDDAIARICFELRERPIERILFVATNDFFNSDTPNKTTTAGTPQDTDIRWQKLYTVGVAMLMDALIALADIAPVEAIYTASNHDLTTMYHAMCHVSDCRQIDPRRVTVDTDAHARKYRLYGNTLIGFSHGDTERKQARSALGALAALPPVEARALWGQATSCEMHAAHLHCEQAIDEVNGVIVRRISSPTASDTWHTDSAYVGAVRKAQTFLYDRKYGLTHTINTPVA